MKKCHDDEENVNKKRQGQEERMKRIDVQDLSYNIMHN